MNKSARQLERYMKGVANHHRIDILYLVHRNPRITLESISRELDINIKTTSEHVRRLKEAGLLNKKYLGRFVSHETSPYGDKTIEFLKSFE